MSKFISLFYCDFQTYLRLKGGIQLSIIRYLDESGVGLLISTIKGLISDAVSTKVDKVSGKGLSTNDYTTAEKTKLAGISDSADAVSFSRSLTGGTKVGTITINGTGTDLYAPTNTDTHYQSKNVVGGTTATSNTSTALTNGNVYLNSVENGAITSTHKISGTGATTVTTDTGGNIIVNSTNTTYSAAGTALGLVKSGGDVTISSGTITVNDDSHNHTISNVDGLQAALDSKSATTHTHTADSELSSTSTNPVQNKIITSALNEKVPVSRTVNGKSLASNISLTASDVGADASGAANTALSSAKSYTDTKINALVGEGASETLDTIGEISAAIEDNQDAISLLNSAIGTKANKTDVDTELAKKSNTGHGHTISQITDLQTTLDGKAALSHGTHVAYSTAVPIIAGTASAGTATTVSRSDHVHPAQTSVTGSSGSCTGNAATASKLATPRTILTDLGSTSSASFNGTSDITPGITGILPLANGGTGASTATGALANLGLTATAAELNYCDGVTSNIQTQIDSLNSNKLDMTATASSSAKVANSLIIKLNGGSTEGTNLFTYNGSSAKTVNITASSIGAATSSHTHSAYLEKGGGTVSGTVTFTATQNFSNFNIGSKIYLYDNSGSLGIRLYSNGSYYYYSLTASGIYLSGNRIA